MNARKRLVNFRVTDEEFRRLKTASSLKNARCLSDFARSAILETALGASRPRIRPDRWSASCGPSTAAWPGSNLGMSRIFDAIADAGP
jgi:hypothetical protein